MEDTQNQETESTEIKESPIDPRIERMINDTITKAVYRMTKQTHKEEVVKPVPKQEEGLLSKDAELNQLRKEFEILKAERELEVQKRYTATKKSRLVETLVENEITDPGLQKLIAKYLDENLIIDGEEVLYKNGDEIQPLSAGVKAFIDSELGKTIRPAKSTSKQQMPSKQPVVNKLTPPTGLTSLQLEGWYRKNGIKL